MGVQADGRGRKGSWDSLLSLHWRAGLQARPQPHPPSPLVPTSSLLLPVRSVIRNRSLIKGCVVVVVIVVVTGQIGGPTKLTSV